ncbi:c-type cytochrome [Polaromonas jejuensis]|uniref:C-type cytochrome n=1 Tax=Polaromonas jejuensis TaxID=457502 RepID=A0ABW0QCP4_9BURK|nr:c-type cytochrome [Polaromonas jejuensis]
MASAQAIAMTYATTPLGAVVWLAAATAALWAVPVHVAAQSVERGKMLYEARCGACHSVDANRIGPAHRGVLGRKAGSAPGFAYSRALAGSKLVWTRDNLLAWLKDPESVIPGQGMNYSLGEASEREDVVAYLATLTSPRTGAAR